MWRGIYRGCCSPGGFGTPMDRGTGLCGFTGLRDLCLDDSLKHHRMVVKQRLVQRSISRIWKVVGYFAAGVGEEERDWLVT